MKLLFLLLFSLFSQRGLAASCCVANTSVPNLMIMPSTWQQTLTLGSVGVVGDVNPKGQSTFRKNDNKEQTTFGRMDLAYRFNDYYQTGVSLRYQNKRRQLQGQDAQDSGWSDVGLFHAIQPIKFQRTWIFQSINIPTSASRYDSQEKYQVDAHGSGTYQAGLGVFHMKIFKTWDWSIGSELHRSLNGHFKNNQVETNVGSFWGGSVTTGAGYIPWRSKFRYGLNLSPRLEGQKQTETNGERSSGRQSLVWDSLFNVTYTWNVQYALGLSYLDQTLVGPAQNTLLNRSLTFLIQSRWL